MYESGSIFSVDITYANIFSEFNCITRISEEKYLTLQNYTGTTGAFGSKPMSIIIFPIVFTSLTPMIIWYMLFFSLLLVSIRVVNDLDPFRIFQACYDKFWVTINSIVFCREKIHWITIMTQYVLGLWKISTMTKFKSELLLFICSRTDTCI